MKPAAGILIWSTVLIVSFMGPCERGPCHPAFLHDREGSCRKHSARFHLNWWGEGVRPCCAGMLLLDLRNWGRLVVLSMGVLIAVLHVGAFFDTAYSNETLQMLSSVMPPTWIEVFSALVPAPLPGLCWAGMLFWYFLRPAVKVQFK